MPFGWRRPLQGLGVDFGAAGVKAVALASERDRFSLLGAGREDLPPGVVQDGAVRDPEKLGAALRRLLGRLGVGCRLLGVSLGGSSVFIKRLSAPSGAFESESDFREAVAREAARHVPFHIESLEFDYQRGPAAGEGDGTVVFGAAPREAVRAHCDAVRRAGREVSRIELEPYALFAAARLAARFDPPPPGAGALALVEIGVSRSSAHVFARNPPPPAPGPQHPDADSPGELLASAQAQGTGAAAPAESGPAGPPDAVLRHALDEAGLSPPIRLGLSGGGALVPAAADSLSGLALGSPWALDPLRPFRPDADGPTLAVAAGLACQQLLDLAGERGRRRR